VAESGAVGAATAAPVDGPALLTPEALLTLRPIGDLALSDDGRLVAFAVGGAAPACGDSARAELWAGAADGSAPPAAVNGERMAVESLPVWAHDHEWLAYCSDLGHPGVASPWVREASGQIRSAADLDGSVESLHWAEDDSFLLALIADPGSDPPGAGSAARLDPAPPPEAPTVRRPGQAWRRLWRIYIDTGQAILVSPPGINVWEVDWPGHGPAVVVTSADSAESAWYDPSVGLCDVMSGEVTVIHRPAGQVQSAVLEPGGQRVAFVEGLGSDRTCVTAEVKIIDISSGQVSAPAPQLDVSQLSWLVDGRLFYVGLDGLESICGYLSSNGAVEQIWRGAATIGPRHGMRAACSRDGSTVVAAMEAPGHPQEACLLDLSDQTWRPLTSVNAGLAELRSADSSRVQWTASDGLAIEGILVVPAEHGESPLPLVAFIHGGPVGSFTFTFGQGPMAIATALANAGYAVLMPNPRGSSGRGRDFAAAVQGDVGGAELTDTLAGIDALCRRGIADAERLAITGGSHGGYISAWAVTQTEVFAAAAPWACVSDWVSFHYTTNIGRFDELFLQSDPADPAGHHFSRSPVTHARSCRTPTLILHGERDLCTPLGQAKELYQALVEANCETELVVYPRAGHGWKERDQVLDTCRRITAWFDRHLKTARLDSAAVGSSDVAG